MKLLSAGIALLVGASLSAEGQPGSEATQITPSVERSVGVKAAEITRVRMKRVVEIVHYYNVAPVKPKSHANKAKSVPTGQRHVPK